MSDWSPFLGLPLWVWLFVIPTALAAFAAMYAVQMERVLHSLHRLSAAALELPGTFFDAGKEPTNLLVISYYPPVTELPERQQGKPRYRAHSDYTGYTILLQDEDDHADDADDGRERQHGDPREGHRLHDEREDVGARLVHRPDLGQRQNRARDAVRADLLVLGEGGHPQHEAHQHHVEQQLRHHHHRHRGAQRGRRSQADVAGEDGEPVDLTGGLGDLVRPGAAASQQHPGGVAAAFQHEPALHLVHVEREDLRLAGARVLGGARHTTRNASSVRVARRCASVRLRSLPAVPRNARNRQRSRTPA